MGAAGGVGQGGSYTSAGEWGFPKVSPDFFGARGKRGILVGAVRREPDPGLGGFSHTAGALDASHLQESHWFPKAAPLAWKNGDLRELGTNSGSVGYFKRNSSHTHNPGKSPQGSSSKIQAQEGDAEPGLEHQGMALPPALH